MVKNKDDQLIIGISSSIFERIIKTKKISKEEYKEKLRLYDVLYNAACRIIAKYQPCAFKEGECFTGMQWHCCGGCCYLSKTGCTTKSLSCKLHLCEEATEKFPECAAVLDALALVADKFHFIGFRVCKQDIFSSKNFSYK